MFRRIVASVGLSAAIAVLASLPISGQGSGAPPPDLVITAYNGGAAPANWTPPKTPWGEPDLQGTWSSDDTANIPISRPAAIGERLFQTDEEYGARLKQVENAVRNAENATSTFRNDFGDRAFRQTSQIVDPPNGVQPQPLPEARKRAAPRDRGTFGNGPFDTPEDFTLYDRCITRGIWGSMMRVIYGNGNRIVQGPGVVAISYEMIHDTRVIYTDGRPHPANMPQYLGTSRGRWDGDTLVVETINLTDKTSIGLNGNGLRHSDKMKMTERIRRVAEDIVQYQLTVDDPVTYPRPFTISIPLTPLDGGGLLPYECHEGNLAIENSLSAERAEDRALAEDLAKGIVRPRRPVQEGGGGGGRGRGAGGGRQGGAAAEGRGGAPAEGRGGAPAEGDQER